MILTRKQIERIRISFQAFSVDVEQADRLMAVCDMALKSLTLDACRKDLIEAKRICDNAQKNHSMTLEELDVALALLRELNDALAIPGWLQPRMDALLDRAEAE